MSHREIWRRHQATVDRTNDLIRRSGAPSGRAKSPDKNLPIRFDLELWAAERIELILSPIRRLSRSQKSQSEETREKEREREREKRRSFDASAWNGEVREEEEESGRRFTLAIN